MEKFLKNYVKEIAEVRGVKLSRQNLKDIATELEKKENIWQELEYWANSIIDDMFEDISADIN